MALIPGEHNTEARAFSSSLLRAIIAFSPKFSNILPFLIFFCPIWHFFEKSHAYPYFLEKALETDKFSRKFKWYRIVT